MLGWWRYAVVMVVVVVEWTSIVTAVPLKKHNNNNRAAAPPSEVSGLDEEVRQLLDLKGQVAQRNLRQLKEHTTATTTTVDADNNNNNNNNNNNSQDNHTLEPASENARASDVRESAMERTHEETFHMSDGTQTHYRHAEHNVLSDGDPVSHVSSDTQDIKEEGHTPHSHTQIEVDVPSQNLHETLLDEDGHTTIFHHDDDDQQKQGSSVRYSPLDLALYIYKTGDEERVTLAIQELIAEGLMTAEEALSYLRSIREHLHYLTLQDTQDDKMESQSDLSSLVKKNILPLPLTEMNLGGRGGGGGGGGSDPEADYEALMERIRGQNEQDIQQYSMEEVIYQLAKIIFKQAMHRGGDEGSERALQEVAALLEKEVERGAITPEGEKKLLDVMVNSLVDSLSETDEVPSGPGPIIDGSSFRLSNEGSFPMRGSSLYGGTAMKHFGSNFFQGSKTTPKRETHHTPHHKN